MAHHPLSNPVFGQGLEADVGVVEVLPVGSTDPYKVSNMLAHAILEVGLAHEDFRPVAVEVINDPTEGLVLDDAE
eukprot:13641366-Heterocapsa_arctica.AAC.1